MQIKTLCVFCGSSRGFNNVYAEETLKLADFLADSGISLVYGGGGAGLMGILAERMLERGAEVRGVIPRLINGKVKSLPLTETILTEDMHQRKKIMYEMSDAFTALPGGIGTVEEISEVYTWQQLGYHTKAVSLYNINNFYDGLSGFLKYSADEGFIKHVHLDRLLIDSDPAGLIKKLESYEGLTVDKWS